MKFSLNEKLAEPARRELAKLYGKLLQRFGKAHLLRRMKAGLLVRAAHSRVKGSRS